MTSLDNAIIAWYEHEGKRFELLVDPDKAYMYKEGKKKDLNNILVSEEVYADAKKAERQKSSLVEKVFGTTDIYKVLEKILTDGHIQLTTEMRRKKLAEKKKQIIAIIAREAIDPRTNAPHPIVRIENAMEQARIQIDPFKHPKDQLPAVIKSLKKILPMKVEKVRVAVKIPAQYVYNCYSVIKSQGLKKEEWTSAGDLIAVVELFAGMKGEFLERLAHLTNGTIESKDMK